MSNSISSAVSHQPSKIARRTHYANIGILSVTLFLVMIITFLFIRIISNNASKNLALSYSMEAAEKFHSYMAQDLILVQKMARSNAMINWFIDKEDQVKKSVAFNEMMDYTKIFQTAHLYFGISESLDGYYIDNTTAFGDFAPLNKLDPLNPSDTWFFDCIRAESDYILDINTDKYGDTWQLLINHKLTVNGNIAGVIGSGLPIQALVNEMFDPYGNKDLIGYVVDKHGVILMDSVYSELYGEEDKKHIHDVDDDPVLVSVVKDYLKDITGHFTSNAHAKVVKLTKGTYEHVSIAPIVNSDWSVVIFYNNELLNGVTDIINLLPLVAALLLSVFLYMAGESTLMKRLIFMPLSRLTQSVSESKKEDIEIFGSDRDDEIGILSRTIRDMRNSLSANILYLQRITDERRRIGNLLDVVNLTAGILLRAPTDEFEHDLLRCMGMIAESVNVDRIYIWKNHFISGELHCTQIYEWSEGAEPQHGKDFTINISYGDVFPRWEEALSFGDCINTLVRDMPPKEQAHLIPQGVLSIFVMPVFVQEQFWGFIGYDDCHNERLFPENEQAVLRSGGMIIAYAILRYEITRNLQTITDELDSAFEEALSASNAKSRFLASTSHEMRTPLNAIIGLSELTLETGEINSEVLGNMEKIYNAGLTLLSTVNDILDISKIEAGKLELVPVEYDISSMINDTVTQTVMHIGEKPIQFILNIDENLPANLYGDDLRIKQIINNLLSNAFKYTKEGKVELGIYSMQTDKTVWIDITVRDTGIGISKENLGNLFTDYSKINTESNRTIEGTGLGLSITKRLVELMDGTITVESDYGKGSVFIAKIRQKAVTDKVIGPDIAKSLKEFRYSAYKSEHNLRLSRNRLPNVQVLVVDDNVVNLDVAKGLLQLYGIKVDCVTSGQEAIDIIRSEKQKYNAIFMDHMMPEMNGVEATRIIRETDTDYAKNIPIIALTANALVGNKEMFLNNGFQAFMSKPIEAATLNAIVREWVWDVDRQVILDGQTFPDAGSEKDQSSVSDELRESNRRSFGKTIAGLDIVRGIKRFGSNEELFFKVLDSYAKNTRPLLEMIKEVGENSLADYAITIHGIKGSSHGIYADMVGAKAEALEEAAKAGDFDFVSANNRAFIEATGKLVDDIEELVGTDMGDPRPRKAKVEIELLSKVLAACKNYDIEKIDEVMTEIDSYEYESDDGLAAWLRDNIDHLNYELIAEKLSDIIDKTEI